MIVQSINEGTLNQISELIKAFIGKNAQSEHPITMQIDHP